MCGISNVQFFRLNPQHVQSIYLHIIFMALNSTGALIIGGWKCNFPPFKKIMTETDQPTNQPMDIVKEMNQPVVMI